MKTKERHFLNFYIRYMYRKTFEDNVGLCKMFQVRRIPKRLRNKLNMFQPFQEDFYKYDLDAWWGNCGDKDEMGKFNSMRQTVVLFLAAMNNEL